jgi:predicted Zn-dependent protease
MKHLWRRLTVVAVAGSLLIAGGLGLSACSTNPATGEQSFTAFMSPSDEMEIGAEEHPKVMKEFGGAYEDADVRRYVTSIGRFLASSSEMSDLPFTFTVLDSPVVNAFALPGGYVYVTRGLMALANSEAELAGVVAHEIGHVTGRHTAQRYSQAVAASIGVNILSILVDNPALSNLAGTGAQLYLLGFSRDQELEADRLGIRYLARTGYDPMAMRSFLSQLEAESALSGQIAGKEGVEQTPDLFRTHPRTADRITQAAQEARGQTNATLAWDREIYLKMIDGLVWGDSPKQGFIRGRLFAHPTLGFRFEAPPGFRLTNTDEAVVGEHENGSLLIFDGDAPPENDLGMMWYLANVWAEGRELSDKERITVNGMDAATGGLRLQNDGEWVDIRLIAYRFDAETIYRFTFVTPVGASAELNEELRRTTYSFRRLSDAEAAQLKPRRLKLVSVRNGDSHESLAQRMMVDDFPLETFRVINGLVAGQPLRVGQQVKLIVE